MVQEIPLNGRYFLDLARLAPGSVTPTSSSFSATPGRGLGALAINTAGNREETVNYMVNGITLNDLVYSSILYQPSISTVQEFKIDNSTLSAEYGQSSGAVVNVATRSGTAQFHGELFEFLRNDALDARNFFTSNSSEPPPFKRNQFGASAGGPIIRGKTFFFTSYEGLRQAQEVVLNSVVLSDAERRSAANSNIAKLVELVPRPNAPLHRLGAISYRKRSVGDGRQSYPERKRPAKWILRLQLHGNQRPKRERQHGTRLRQLLRCEAAVLLTE
jgi:hypothetical protein